MTDNEESNNRAKLKQWCKDVIAADKELKAWPKQWPARIARALKVDDTVTLYCVCQNFEGNYLWFIRKGKPIAGLGPALITLTNRLANKPQPYRGHHWPFPAPGVIYE